MAVAEMAPDLIWAPHFFWPQEIWASKNLVPDKYGLQEIWTPRNLLPSEKVLRNQISWSPYFSGLNEIGDH